jgi:tape measure domain-containing protein
MAVTLDELRATMRMELNPFMKDLQKMHGVNAKAARQIEATWQNTNKRLDNIGRNMAQSLAAPLLGVGAAMSVDDVLRYADAWTSAKNSLAVAGVVGDNQVAVLDRIYQSAQDNAAPLNAMADLYGKAAQAGDNLGASQADLLKFTDGVGVALRVAGSSAGAASGALSQLGQLLGSARVQAEEFNSVNDGARPILIAVANGLDEAGGSVSKLKALVNDGKVSSQQFFQAFLKGLPTIQKMAGNATQTIEQGITKVSNAFTKYVGQTDESLSASQRLVVGLNALADNFDTTADVALKVASVIAAALVGRSIAGMIASLGLGTAAIARFVTALRSAASVAGLATAMGGLSVAAGPIGAVIGVTAVGALALFASMSDDAGKGADSFAARLESMGEVATTAAGKTSEAAAKLDAVSLNKLTAEVGAANEQLRIQHRFGPRMPEWFMSIHMILFGYVLLLPTETFNQPAFTAFRLIPTEAVLGMSSENVMGGAMLLIGCIRILGLIVNGARKHVTPQIRQISAGIGCMLWAGITYGFFSSDVVSTWLAIYPAFAVSEAINIYRAAHDEGEVRNGATV